MGLHKELRKVRKEMKWTQKQMADKIGISRGHYCGMETGKRKPTLEVLEKIDSATGKQLVITFLDRT